VIAKDKWDMASKKLGISVEEIKHNQWEHEEFNWE
jgi:hypothetical protein